MQKKSERLFRIFNRLKDQPLSVEELCSWCKSQNIPVGLRTIYRYLNELSDTCIDNGFRLISYGNGARDLKWQVVPMGVHAETRVGDAITGIHIMSHLSGMDMQTIGEHVVEDVVGETLKTFSTPNLHFASLVNHLIVTNWGQAHYDEKDHSVMGKAMKAILGKRKATMELLPQLQAEDPIVGKHAWKIYSFVLHRGSIFLACGLDGSKKIYFLDLESIVTVRLTTQKFKTRVSKKSINDQLRKRFGITSHDGPFYRVKLAFHPSDLKDTTGYKNPFLQKRIWHSDQRFTMDHSNKYLIMEFEAQLNRELVGWVMMWMDHVKILEPNALKTLVKSKMASIQNVLEGGEPLLSLPKRF